MNFRSASNLLRFSSAMILLNSFVTSILMIAPASDFYLADPFLFLERHCKWLLVCPMEAALRGRQGGIMESLWLFHWIHMCGQLRRRGHLDNFPLRILVQF